MGSFFEAAIFLALFYLLINPSKVKARLNLMVAWFIFIGAMGVSLLAAINGDFARWISAIQQTALAVSLFFMLISVDPGAKPSVSMPPAPPSQ